MGGWMNRRMNEREEVSGWVGGWVIYLPTLSQASTKTASSINLRQSGQRRDSGTWSEERMASRESMEAPPVERWVGGWVGGWVVGRADRV